MAFAFIVAGRSRRRSGFMIKGIGGTASVSGRYTEPRSGWIRGFQQDGSPVFRQKKPPQGAEDVQWLKTPESLVKGWDQCGPDFRLRRPGGIIFSYLPACCI